jgi:hypothetical protein
MSAPIALFTYNRPAHAERTVRALQNCLLSRQSELHVYSDGPRNPEAEPAVREVRRFLETVDGFAAVRIHERKNNLGLAASVIDGVTRLCDEFGRVIVLEDDLVVSPQFLSFMNAALERYQNDSRVMQIAGNMFPVDVQTTDDAFFLPFVSSWGWATWGRAWREFDPGATAYAQLKSDAKRRRAFDMNGGYGYSSMLEAHLAGKIDSWAIRWNLSVFVHDGMVLYPKKSLVENIGFDGSGVHCRGESLDQLMDLSFVPKRFPAPGIEPAIRNQVFEYFRARRSPGARLRALMQRAIR